MAWSINSTRLIASRGPQVDDQLRLIAFVFRQPAESMAEDIDVRREVSSVFSWSPERDLGTILFSSIGYLLVLRRDDGACNPPCCQRLLNGICDQRPACQEQKVLAGDAFRSLRRAGIGANTSIRFTLRSLAGLSGLTSKDSPRQL